MPDTTPDPVAPYLHCECGTRLISGERCPLCGWGWNDTLSAEPDPVAAYLAKAAGTLDDLGYEEEAIPGAVMTAGLYARRFLAAVDAVLALHHPHRIYTECDHAHAYDSDAERDKAGAIDCGDFVTCEDGYMYSACRECCIEDGQTEACADGHHHGIGNPICATVADLSAALLGEETPDD